MSLYGVLRTGVSGMAAQASRLATVADNIGNASTTGYKRAFVEFSSMVLESGSSSYTSGGVTSNIRYAIGEQGSFQYTTSAADLAIKGDGFFVVKDAGGTPYLTRAGSFVPDSTGNLVNTSGFYLMGFPLSGGDPSIVANGLAGLERVNISQMKLEATASTKGQFDANLPAKAAIVAAANLPSANAGTAQYTAKTSLVAYDNLGNEVVLDVYLTKTADNTWEVAVFDKATAGPSGGFPYTSGPLATTTLNFDPATGDLTAASASSLAIPVPNGQTLNLDMKDMTQLGADYTVMNAKIDGNAPSAVDRVDIGEDGTLYVIYENGARQATYKIPLADVASPDRLTPRAGNVYLPSAESGDVKVGEAGKGGFGTMISGALEQSNVDLASELTAMIEAQRSYTANSKVFQSGSELLDVLVNLKR